MAQRTHKTREQWLNAAAKAMHPLLAKHGAKRPAGFRVSCGFPRGTTKAIGQCWSDTVSADQHHEIFISPVLVLPVSECGLLPTLLHEMIHAYVGLIHKHGGEFKRVARAVGLEGKLTATYVAHGSDLHAKLEAIAARLGPYPHGAMRPPIKHGVPSPMGQKNITFRSVDPDYEGFSASCKAHIVAAHGAPRDPGGTKMVPSRDWVKGDGGPKLYDGYDPDGEE